MSEHTPGPWKVMLNGNPLSAGIVAIIQHSPERLLTVEEDHFGGPWCAPDTWEANARLIAAAPDLLDALKELDERLRKSFAGPITAAEAYDSFYQELVAAAIAKAEGR